MRVRCARRNMMVTVAVSTLLCDLKKDDRPFGGIPMLCGGDFRQIPPVVESNAYEDTCNAMLSSSAWLWPQFEICNLTHPVRDAQDPEYSEYVDSLGDGNEIPRDLRRCYDTLES